MLCRHFLFVNICKKVFVPKIFNFLEYDSSLECKHHLACNDYCRPRTTTTPTTTTTTTNTAAAAAAAATTTTTTNNNNNTATAATTITTTQSKSSLLICSLNLTRPLGHGLLTHLCLTFHYWNGCDVGVIYILLLKVIAESDFFHTCLPPGGTLSRGAQN
jgi:hypothetical protein